MSTTRNLLAASRTAASPSPSRATTSGASPSAWLRIASPPPAAQSASSTSCAASASPPPRRKSSAQHLASATAPGPSSAPAAAPLRRRKPSLPARPRAKPSARTGLEAQGAAGTPIACLSAACRMARPPAPPAARVGDLSGSEMRNWGGFGSGRRDRWKTRRDPADGSRSAGRARLQWRGGGLGGAQLK